MMFLLVCFALAMLVCFAFLPYGLRDLARGRKYKSGTGWCVWRWTDVHSEYILRLHVLKTPWFAVCLHWINKPDEEPWLHDHPVTFLSLILKGYYGEHRAGSRAGRQTGYRRWFNFVRGTREDSHRIYHVAHGGCLTLCLMGPKTREWGFHMPTGWIGWQDYYARLKAGEDMRGYATAKKLDEILNEVYTEERVRALAGAPIGTFVDLERPIDDGPTDAFVAEEPTEPLPLRIVRSEDPPPSPDTERLAGTHWRNGRWQ